jgi:hypothetical protein
MTAAAAEASLRTAYEEATAIIKEQPQGEKGAVVVLSMIEDDMVGLAFGSPENWAKMLFGVAERNQDFKLALWLTMQAIEDNTEDRDY